MTSLDIVRPTRGSTPLLSVLTALCLAACGGGDDPQAASTPSDDVRVSATRVTPTLINDDGSVMPSDPAATPADPGARTRAGRYATEAQAEQLEHALGERAIRTRVDSGPEAGAAVDEALRVAFGRQAALALDADAPVLVRGDDPRLAAHAADRLEAAGFTRVFLVAP